MDTIRVPGLIRATAAAKGSVSRSETMVWSNGGTTTVSAVSSASAPCSTATVKSALVRTGRPSTVQVRTSYRPSA